MAMGPLLSILIPPAWQTSGSWGLQKEEQQFQKKKLLNGRGCLRPTLPAGLQWPSQKLQVGYAGSPAAGGRQNSGRRGALRVLSVLQRCRRGPGGAQAEELTCSAGLFPSAPSPGPCHAVPS